MLAPKTAAVPAEAAARLAVGRGLFFSTVTADRGGTVFVLPPRYRGHEVELARIYRFTGGVQPAGVRKVWGVLRDLFTGGRVAKAA